MTNRTREEDIVAGLNAGADDYIFKPARKIELLARVNAVLRRVYPINIAEKEKHFDYIFNLKEKKIFFNEHEIELTHKEFDLALLLFRHLSRPLSRSHILESVWGSDIVVGDRTIDVHIRKLREKLGENYITTVKGVGYKFSNPE